MSSDVREAVDTSIDRALDQGILDKDLDAAAMAGVRALADKIDAWDVIVDWALDDAALTGGRPAVPANDNVSLSALLKYLNDLGLTPISRDKAFDKKGATGGKLAQLRAVEGKRVKRRA